MTIDFDAERRARAHKAKEQAREAANHGVTLGDFVAYREQRNYIFKPTRAMWPASAVDDELPPVPLPGGKTIAASKWIAGNQAVQQITWAPGEPELIEGRLTSDGGFIEREGVTVFNLYRAPACARGDAAKADRWSEHVRHVYPSDADHIIMFLAHRVQRPQEKINHALLLGGNQGIGKDTLLEPVKRAVGHWNFGEASPSDMFASFNRFQRSVILRISEGRDLGDVDRFKLYDRMKTVIAAPPDVLKINEKNLREYYVPNCCSVIITSNYKTDGIYLPEDDRRHYVAYSEWAKEDFSQAYWDGIWKWYEDDGGYGHVAAYLSTLDISSFAPKAPPPKTAAFQAIADAGRAPEIPEMMDTLDKLDNPDAVTLEQLRSKAPEPFLMWLDDRRNRRTIPHRLEACGYVPVRNPDAPSHGLWQLSGGRCAIYAKRSLPYSEQVLAARRLMQGSRYQE
ncbi:MAG: primase-helicase family protein [Methylocella sp.]